MAKDLQILAKKIGLEINGKAQVIANGSDKSLLKIKKGDKVKLLKNDNKAYEDLVVLRDGDNLIITYADGSVVTIENFYAVEDVTLELPVAQNEVHLISSNYELASSVEVIYAQGDMSKFSSIFEGNSSYLSAISNYSLAETGLSAAGETTSASGVAGFSTASLVLGGLAIAGVVAAAASGGSSGGSGSSSSPSVPVPPAPEGVDAEAVVHDGPIAGLYYEVVKTADNTVIHKGYTDIDGKFSYKNDPAYKVVFKIGDLTLADIEATDIKREIEVANKTTKVVTLQDLAKVDVTATDNATVKKYAQLLQTLDADGNANNGIQILRDQKGNIVKLADGEEFAEENGMVTKDSYNTLSAKTLKEDAKAENVLVTKEKQGTANVSTNNVTEIVEAGVAVVTEDDAKAHLDNQLKSYYGEKATNADDLIEKLTSDGKAIVTTDLDISDKDLGEASGTVLVDDKNTSSISLTVKPEQLAKLNFAKGDKDTVTVKVLDNDKDLTANKDLTKADVLEINGKTGVVLNAAQSKALTVKDTTTGGNYKVVDSVENLLTSDSEVKIHESTEVVAADVVAKLGENKDISSLKLHSQVTKIDLNGAKDAVINVAQKAKVTLTGEENYSLKDTAANLEGASNITGKNVEITTAATIAQLNTIKGKIGAEATMTYKGVVGDATDFTTITEPNKALLEGKTVTVNKAKVEDVKAIDEALTKSKLVYNIEDSYENLTKKEDAQVVQKGSSIKVTDTITVDQFKDIDSKFDSAIIATLAPATIKQLKTVEDSTKNVVTMTIKNEVAKASDLLEIAKKTSNVSTINISAIKSIEGSSEEVAALKKAGFNLDGATVAMDSNDASEIASIVAPEGSTPPTNIDLSKITEISGTLGDVIKAFTYAGASVEKQLNKATTKVTITDAEVAYDGSNKATIEALFDGREKGTIVFSNLTNLKGNFADVNQLINSPSVKLAKSVTVELTDDASASEINIDALLLNALVNSDIVAKVSISKVTPSSVNAVNIKGSFEDFKAIYKNDNIVKEGSKATLKYSATTVEKPVNADELLEFNKGKTVDTTAIQHLTGSAKAINTLDGESITKGLASNIVVTLSGEEKAADIIALKARPADSTDATIDASKVTVLNGTVAGVKDALIKMDTKPATLEIKVTAPETGNSSADDLYKLKKDNTFVSEVDASTLTKVAGTSDQIDTLLKDEANANAITKPASYDVIVSDSLVTNAGSVTKLQDYKAKVKGDVEATLTINDADAIETALTELYKLPKADYTINIEFNGDALTKQQLESIKAKVDGNVIANSVTAFEGTAEELIALLGGANPKLTLNKATVNLTVTDNSLKAADIKVLNELTDNKLTISATQLTGTTEELKAILTAIGANEVTDVKATVTKIVVKGTEVEGQTTKTAKAADLDELKTEFTSDSLKIDISDVTVIEGEQEKLKAILENADTKYEGIKADLAITVTDDSGLTLAKIKELDSNKTKVITVNNLGEQSVADIKSILNSDELNSKNIYKAVTTKDTDVQIAAKDIVDIKGKIDGLVFNAAFTTITSTFTNDATAEVQDSETKTVLNALKIAENKAVEITNAVSVANVNAIDNATTGVLTVTVKEGDMATLKTLNAKESNVYTVAVTDTSADAKELVDLAAKASNLTASAVTTLTTNAENYKYLIDKAGADDSLDSSNDTGAISKLTNPAVTINGEIAIAALNKVDALTTGIITATVAGEQDVATLKTLTDANTNNVYTATVKGNSDGLLTISNISTENTDYNQVKTVVKNLNISSTVKKIEAKDTDISLLKSTVEKTKPATGNSTVAVEIHNAVSIEDVKAIDALTSGVITAKVKGVADELTIAEAKELENTTINKLTITVKDVEVLSFADLKAISSKSATEVTINSIESITAVSSVAEFAAIVKKDVLSLEDLSGRTYHAQVTVADGVTVKAEDLTTITNEGITISLLDLASVSGTVEQLEAIKDDAKIVDVVKSDIDIKVEGSANATKVKGLDATFKGVDISKVTEITDEYTNIANVKELLNNSTKADNVKVSVTGALDLATINEIASKTSGTITVTEAKLGDVANIDTLLTKEDVRATTLDIENTEAHEQTFNITANQVLELVGAGNTLNFKLDATDKVKLDAGWTKLSEANTYKNEASNVTIKFDEAAAEVKSGETVL